MFSSSLKGLSELVPPKQTYPGVQSRHLPGFAAVEYIPLPHLAQATEGSLLIALPEPKVPPGQGIGADEFAGQ